MWVTGETTFTTRCVACDGPITGRAYTPIVAKYHEYCPACTSAIGRAITDEARYQRKAAKAQRVQNEFS